MEFIMTTDTILEEKTKQRLKEPPKYKVVIFNDNYTPVEFVIAMLVAIFRKDEREAVDITLKIHHEGSAVGGIYSHEIAEQKVTDAISLARANGHPLQLKSEIE